MFTEEQLAALKGEKGDKGDKGEPGQNGADGQPGRDGIDGTNGLDGAPGADGKDGYTPVKGTDYFTAEEIASIEANAAAAVDLSAYPTTTQMNTAINNAIAAIVNGNEVSY